MLNFSRSGIATSATVPQAALSNTVKLKISGESGFSPARAEAY